MFKTVKEVAQALSVPIVTRKRKDRGYLYVKGEDVIAKLNEAFGYMWSSEILEVEEKYKHILVSLRLTGIVEGEMVFHDAYGGAPILMKKDRKTNSPTSQPVDIGNTYKAACTSALKKAAEMFGIGVVEEEHTGNTYTSNYNNSSGPSKSSLTPRTSAPQRTMQRPPPPAAKSTSKMRQRPAPLRACKESSSSTSPSQQRSTPQATSTPNLPAAVDADGIPGGSGPLTSSQEVALSNLTNFKGLVEATVIAEALKGTPGESKTEFKKLTKSEAVKTITHINS